MSKKANEITLQVFANFKNKTLDNEQNVKLYSVALDVAETATMVDRDNFLAFSILAQLKKLIDKTDEARSFAKKGLEAMVRSQDVTAILDKSELNLSQDYKKAISTAQEILKNIYGGDLDTKEIEIYSNKLDIFEIECILNELKSTLTSILRHKYKTREDHDSLDSFVTDFPLFVFGNDKISELEIFKFQYIDYVLDTDPLNYLNTMYFEDKDEYKEELLGKFTESKKYLKIDLFEINESDLWLFFSGLAKDEIEYISPKTLNLLQRVLIKSKNDILRAVHLAHLVDKTPDSFSQDEIIRKEDLNLQEIEKKAKLIDIRLKSEPIDFFSQTQTLKLDLAKNSLVEQAKPGVLKPEEISTIIDRVSRVKKSLQRIPKYFLDGHDSVPTENDFNINTLLEIFDKIKISSELVLDYVYVYRVRTGEPFPYTRRKDASRIESFDEYSAMFHMEDTVMGGREPDLKNSYPYTMGLSFEKSTMGYFQFSFFCMLVRRFYLCDHSNYNSRSYFFDLNELKNHIQNSEDKYDRSELAILDRLDLAPKVQIFNDWGKVTLATFETNRGYSFLKIYIKAPNIFFEFEDSIILKSKSTTFY
ncbi:MAG: hypothetical protein ACK5P5_04510 [Pseudobdellovibrionaceae bacterium]